MARRVSDKMKAKNSILPKAARFDVPTRQGSGRVIRRSSRAIKGSLKASWCVSRGGVDLETRFTGMDVLQ
jgi:hypothetical protein